MSENDKPISVEGEDARSATKQTRRRRRKSDETKRETFVRLAESRTEAAREKIRLVGNLAAPRHYEFTSADIDKIFDAIEDEVRRARTRFDLIFEAPGEFSLKDQTS